MSDKLFGSSGSETSLLLSFFDSAFNVIARLSSEREVVFSGLAEDSSLLGLSNNAHASEEIWHSADPARILAKSAFPEQRASTKSR